MSIELLQSVWPYLLILFYVLVVAMIKTLLGHFQRETALHNLLRESTLRRNAYLKELESRMSED